MKKNVITISRQHGSGGRTIGLQLAEKLGYKLYEKEIISEIALKLNIGESEADDRSQNLDELISARFSTGFIPFAGFSLKDTADVEKVYRVQKEIIQNAATEGNCVVIGRNADAILADYPNAFHIFIKSNMDYRVNRMFAMGLKQSVFSQEELADEALTKKSIRHSLENSDKTRAAHYNFFTGRTWGDAQNYSLVLDTSVFTDEQAIELILKAVEMAGK